MATATHRKALHKYWRLPSLERLDAHCSRQIHYNITDQNVVF